ncbi:TMV resistance protein N-like [Juglans regia]|uniref:TMV resistance protein N-like n=2 Tax=Juglans regia TaxID=51240 RepID=A0A2I4DVS9_JUGRE|nr:TMV resistance protein N-like [Juglans regia]
MQRSSPLLAKSFARKIQLHYSRNQIPTIDSPSCDVFLSHRGIDTKKTAAGLLYYQLFGLGIRPFLDSRSMKPGDKLYDHISLRVRNSKIGVLLFSSGFCQSRFCLYELALMMESKKRVVPIFWDVKPSQLLVKDDGIYLKEDLQRFNWALEEAKNTVGLPFDSMTGDWSEFLGNASDAIIKNLQEVEEEEMEKNLKHQEFQCNSLFMSPQNLYSYN